MGSLENPKTWVPYMINTKDCSQGFCSLYCPQWCNIIFPPPPPFEFPIDHKDSKFSPLVVALIGILASAFLLVSYYIIMSKYCKNRDSSLNGREDQNPIDESRGNNQDSSPSHELSQQAPLPHPPPNSGLDETLIKSITMFKYKKEMGFIDATDCSVCLSEFQENESLRLLPKCSHAFHRKCIDTWLKSHSNCPLCRANIVFVNSLTPQLCPVLEPPIPSSSSTLEGSSSSQNSSQEEDIEMGNIQEMDLYPNNLEETPPSRHLEDSYYVTSIGVMKNKEGERIRRSVSMNDCCVSHGHLSVVEVLHIDQCPYWDGGGETSKRPVVGKSSARRFCGNGVVQCAPAGCAGVRMSNGGKGRNMSIPL